MAIPFDMTQAPEAEEATLQHVQPHPMWCRPVTFSWLGPNEFEAIWGGKSSGPLCLEEVFAVIAALTGAGQAAPILQCFRTPEQIAAQEATRQRRLAEAAARQAKTVTFEASLDAARDFQAGLSDILCWARGFRAAQPDGDSQPLGIEELRDLNTILKRAIERTEKAKS